MTVPVDGRLAVSVRRLTSADIPFVMSWDAKLFPSSWDRSLWQQHMGSHRAIAIGAVGPDGTLIAWGGLMSPPWSQPFSHHRAEVSVMAVVPTMQGNRLGLLILASLLRIARQAGKSEVVLEVEEGNTPAETLYRSMGFEETRYLSDYYGRGKNAKEMILRDLQGPAIAARLDDANRRVLERVTGTINVQRSRGPDQGMAV